MLILTYFISGLNVRNNYEFFLNKSIAYYSIAFDYCAKSYGRRTDTDKCIYNFSWRKIKSVIGIKLVFPCSREVFSSCKLSRCCL